MKLRLERDEFNATEILSKQYINNVYECEILELPWRNNQKRISCIPAGKYKVVKRNSPKYGDHLHITGVENRSLILYHWGNTHKDILGCLITGAKRGYLGSVRAVLDSRTTFNAFKDKVYAAIDKGEEVELEIIECR